MSWFSRRKIPRFPNSSLAPQAILKLIDADGNIVCETRDIDIGPRETTGHHLLLARSETPFEKAVVIARMELWLGPMKLFHAPALEWVRVSEDFYGFITWKVKITQDDDIFSIRGLALD